MADADVTASGPVRQLEVSNGMKVLVDELWFPELVCMKWTAFQSKPGAPIYARRLFTENDGKRVGVFMHRLIMGVEPEERIDHRNGNTLDNRFENLRFCNQRQNMWNIGPKKSRAFKGTSRSSSGRYWIARIRHEGKNLYLGTFLTEEDAAQAYNEAAVRFHGEFARLNLAVKREGLNLV